LRGEASAPNSRKAVQGKKPGQGVSPYTNCELGEKTRTCFLKGGEDSWWTFRGGKTVLHRAKSSPSPNKTGGEKKKPSDLTKVKKSSREEET